MLSGESCYKRSPTMGNRSKRQSDPILATKPGFGKRLKLARTLKNIAQADLAGRVGVRTVTVSRNETDAMSAKKSTIEGYCRELGVSQEWLLEGRGPGPEQGAIEDERAEALELYYSTPFGADTPPNIRELLETTGSESPFTACKIRILTMSAIHDVRLLVERHADLAAKSHHGD